MKASKPIIIKECRDLYRNKNQTARASFFNSSLSPLEAMYPVFFISQTNNSFLASLYLYICSSSIATITLTGHALVQIQVLARYEKYQELLDNFQCHCRDQLPYPRIRQWISDLAFLTTKFGLFYDLSLILCLSAIQPDQLNLSLICLYNQIQWLEDNHVTKKTINHFCLYSSDGECQWPDCLCISFF